MTINPKLVKHKNGRWYSATAVYTDMLPKSDSGTIQFLRDKLTPRWQNQNPNCTACGHPRDEHEEEPPYYCYCEGFCECQGFSYALKQENR